MNRTRLALLIILLCSAAAVAQRRPVRPAVAPGADVETTTGTTSPQANSTDPGTSSSVVARPPAPGFRVALQGLGCGDAIGVRVFSWNFGSAKNVTISSIGPHASDPQLANLQLLRMLDECSSTLIAKLLNGQSLANVALIQYDGNGTPIMRILLTNAIVSEYQISSSGGNDKPTESVSLAYQTITFIKYEGGSTPQFCYDLSKPGPC